jgi:hypothetical protein
MCRGIEFAKLPSLRITNTLLASGLAMALANVGAAAQTARPASPLVRLQKLGNDSTHLHTDEVRHRASDQKLFHCSYTFGVIDTRNPDAMVYLAENLRHTIPGDTRRPGCIHLAWEGDVVYTVHRGNIDNPTFLSGWDLRPDPANPQKLNPVQLPVLQEPGVSYEGLDTANGHIYVALRAKGLGIYKRDADKGFVRVGTSTDLNNAWGVRVRGTTAFVSDGLAGLAILDVADPAKPRLIGRVTTGGQARGLALEGNIAYVAAGSAGLVVVDISKLASPRVIARAETPGSAIRVDFSAGRVYVAAWNDARVYDVAVPAKPRFIGAVRMTKELGGADDARPPVTSRTLGVAARGDVMFVGNWHQIYSYRVVPNRVAPSLALPEEINLIDFGPVAQGASASVPLTLTNQGTAPLTVTGVSSDKPQFTATPSQARILPGKTSTLTLTYTASTTEKETSLLHIKSDDPAEPSRAGYLVGNQPGLGVGRKLPETTINLVDGGQWSSTKEAKGQVTLLAYFATF